MVAFTSERPRAMLVVLRFARIRTMLLCVHSVVVGEEEQRLTMKALLFQKSSTLDLQHAASVIRRLLLLLNPMLNEAPDALRVLLPFKQKGGVFGVHDDGWNCRYILISQHRTLFLAKLTHIDDGESQRLAICDLEKHRPDFFAKWA